MISHADISGQSKAIRRGVSAFLISASRVFASAPRRLAAAPDRRVTRVANLSRARSCKRARRGKPLAYQAATSTSQPSIHDNNGTSPRPPPYVPGDSTRQFIIWQCWLAHLSPRGTGSHRRAAARSGCLRRIPRRNLRIHTQPGLRINALPAFDDAQLSRIRLSRLSPAPPCFLFSSSLPSFFLPLPLPLLAPFRVFDVSYPVINLRSHTARPRFDARSRVNALTTTFLGSIRAILLNFINRNQIPKRDPL